MKRLAFVAMVLFFASTLLLVGCAKKEVPAPKPPEAFKTELKSASFFPTGQVASRALFVFQDKLTEKSKGAITFRCVGGPEAIPAPELPDALKRGVIDLMINSAQWIAVVPESKAVAIPTWGIREEHESGWQDLMNKIYQEKLNAVYLGRDKPGTGFVFYTKSPVYKVDDFKGMKIRGAEAVGPVIKVVGAAWVNIPLAEVYVALQQGIIDGLVYPNIAFYPQKYYEVVKYIIDPAFGQTDGGLWLNLDTWKRLPKDMQKLVTDVALETQLEMVDFWKKELLADRQLLVEKGGMKGIMLPADEAKRFLDLTSSVMWEDVLRSAPKYGAQLKEIVEKWQKKAR